MSNIDKPSFIYGMVTAFCECVINESKPLAFSPPFHKDMLLIINDEILKISKEMELNLFLEKNDDLIENNIYFYVIYKFDSELLKYQNIRKKGFSPLNNFNEFKNILGYGVSFSQGIENIVPKMQKEPPLLKTTDRILF